MKSAPLIPLAQANALLRKIEIDMEHVRRNQAVIDDMKRGNWRAELAGRIHNYPIFFWTAVWLLVLGIILIGAGRIAFAEENAPILSIPGAGVPATAPAPRIQCPTPGQSCRILVLTQQEETVLMQTNGVLDTAAQARALDLGQFSVYFKTRIAGAPQGEIVPLPAASPAK